MKNVKGSTQAERFANMNNKQQESAVLGFAIIAILIIGTIWWIWPNGGKKTEKIISHIEKTANHSQAIAKNQPVAPVTTGKISRGLGHKPSGIGSAEQAAELLRLISEFDGKSRYEISYTSDGDSVVFGCDMPKQLIVRIHQRIDGSGSQESWTGDVLYRLQSATGSGTLNDTPTGKRPVTVQYF